MKKLKKTVLVTIVFIFMLGLYNANAQITDTSDLCVNAFDSSADTYKIIVKPITDVSEYGYITIDMSDGLELVDSKMHINKTEYIVDTTDINGHRRIYERVSISPKTIIELEISTKNIRLDKTYVANFGLTVDSKPGIKVGGWKKIRFRKDSPSPEQDSSQSPQLG